MPSYADMMKAGAVQKVDFIITSPKQLKHGTEGQVSKMRTIDADALIEGYKHLGYDPKKHYEEGYIEGWRNGFNAAVDHCIQYAIHAPTVFAEPQWIPISEQMPKKAGNYLVTDHKGDIARYIFLDSESSKDYWMRCVKAWMPLPEPYKAKSEEV